MQEQDRTYYDDEKLLNANITQVGTKAAKLSSIQNFRKKTEAIKEKLRTETKAAEVSMETTQTEVTPAEIAPVASEVETKEVEAKTEEPVNDSTIQFPTKESLEARTEGTDFYGVNNVEQAKNDGEISFRKLRVDPKVVKYLNYTIKTIGADKVVEKVETNTEVAPAIESSMETSMETVPVQETPKAFDFSALPGVGENSVKEQPSFEDKMHTEQDNRLNDYLNRDNFGELSSSNLSEIEEIRKLKREIEEARESLQQVKANVGDLQQRDSEISEQLAMYKQSLMQQRDAVNAELVDQTREWNDLTQLVREKQSLIDDNESYGMNKVA